jgi:hypothetical protein
VKNAMMKALQEVVGKAGANMSEASRQAILALIDDDASDQTGRFLPTTLISTVANITPDTVAITNAHLLGALVKVLPVESAVPLIKYASSFPRSDCSTHANLIRNRILNGTFSHASVLGLNALLAECPDTLTENFSVELPTVICQGIANKDVSRIFNQLLLLEANTEAALRVR